ncbi:TonB-dependent receptor plug domain-containing protein [Caulobacter sp. 17J65-9]|uniref:TonB-dependent receptor n=1 Tax=Caulobacter sp. 17J65-9 TaxID=2709382 RepID=UPI0013CC0EC7|nr:TonB-dependent receptor plug domain-containing protein [Caulobacter sp. 17J65-9]NEX91768.1 TonB-dependent receptor plug domain-containing protein [Caulobacter sp. 17J65-9]
MRKVRLLACSSVALIAAMSPGVVMAQAQSAGSTAADTAATDKDKATELGDVVVTARRREEAVRDVPSTITAMSAEQLEAKSPIEGVGDLLQTVPGARFNGLQSENLAEVSIRGSGTQRATSADSGVGLFVNGAYVGSSTLGGRNFKRIDYFDLARIEVLEGPQGALYGRNSEYGSVNVVLAQPQQRNGGRVSATYTDDLEQLRMEGVVNQQLSDKVAVRLGAQVTGQGAGQYYNPNQNKYYDHTDGYIVRGQIRYTDGPLDVNLLVDSQDMNLPTFANQWVVPAGQIATIPLGYTGPRYDIPQDTLNDLHQKVDRAMLTAKYDLGWGALTSTTMALRSRSQQHFSAAVDLATEAMFQSLNEIGLYPLGGTYTDAKDETFYQDVHITGDAIDGDLQWLAGAEYLAQDDTYVRDVTTSPCALTASSGICGGTPTAPICYRLKPTALTCPTTFPLAFGTHRLVPSEYRSAAVYGSLKYQIGDLSLDGELRYSRDDKTASQSDFRLYTTTPVGTPTTYEFEQNNLSYAASASYRLHGPVPALIYARTGTGYRAGGVNNGTAVAVAPNPLRPAYENENTTSYEVGLKSDVTKHVFFRLSAYTSETTDAIASVLDGCTVANVCAQAGQIFNINGGTVRIKGIEAALDSNFRIGEGRLMLSLNGAHQSAKWEEVASVPGAPILDSQVAQMPDWTMSANVNYRRPLVGDLNGFFNVAYNGQRGGGQDTVTAAAPFIPLEDLDNVDLRTGVDFRRTEVAFFVKNATDEVIPVLKLQQGAIPLANRYSRPRTVGVSVSYRW